MYGMPRAQGSAGAAIVDVLSGFMLLRILSAYIRVGDTAGAWMRRILTGRKWLLTSGSAEPALGVRVFQRLLITNFNTT